MATTKTASSKKGGIGFVALAAIAILGFVVWKSRSSTSTKYQLNQMLSLAGAQDVYTIVGVWEVNGVNCYIMTTPAIIGTVAYPVTDVDNSSYWTLAA